MELLFVVVGVGLCSNFGSEMMKEDLGPLMVGCSCYAVSIATWQLGLLKIRVTNPT